MSQHAIYTPDRAIVAQVQAIEPTLSIAWVETARGGRWGVFHDLQVPDNFDETVDLVARQLQQAASEGGHTLDLTDCAYTAAQAIRDGKLVCYVTEDDGSFAPLDGRIVHKLQRMNWNRLNLGLKDWREMMRARQDHLRDARFREQNDVWDCIRKDPVFQAQVSDILWGLKPMRSVYVKGVPHANDRQRPSEAVPDHTAGA